MLNDAVSVYPRLPNKQKYKIKVKTKKDKKYKGIAFIKKKSNFAIFCVLI
jgi:hypothetical protein